jgi:hypothetical protein
VSAIRKKSVEEKMADEAPTVGQVFYVLSRLFHYIAAVLQFLFVPKSGADLGSWRWFVGMFARHPEAVMISALVLFLVAAAIVITVWRMLPRSRYGILCLIAVIAMFSLLGISMSYGWLSAAMSHRIRYLIDNSTTA